MSDYDKWAQKWGKLWPLVLQSGEAMELPEQAALSAQSGHELQGEHDASRQQ